MFINFWYVAALARDLTGKPMKVRMLGQTFVLFRDEAGQAHCLSNVCTHRGGSLADGKVKNGHVECPYHGWQFDGKGACAKIPSIGADGKIPSRTHIDSYPVQEKFGLIFCFLGDLPEAERPPLMEVAEWGQPGWHGVQQSLQWNIDYKRSIENSIDPAHNEFVHDTHGFSGLRDEYKVGELTFKETPWGVGFWNKMYAPPLAEGKMRQVSGREEATFIDTGTGHHGPNCVWTYIHPTSEMMMHQYLYETPAEVDKTTLFLVSMRNFLLSPDHDERIMERNAYVAAQDRLALEAVEPVVTPRDNVHEVLMPADVPIAKYREFCKSWEAKGWRIDTDAMTANRLRRAYAIPSPARRESKNWVIDPVPMLPGGDAAKAAAE